MGGAWLRIGRNSKEAIVFKIQKGGDGSRNLFGMSGMSRYLNGRQNKPALFASDQDFP
jgi:hypothetical protein